VGPSKFKLKVQGSWQPKRQLPSALLLDADAVQKSVAESREEIEAQERKEREDDQRRQKEAERESFRHSSTRRYGRFR
jgi:hypothetical protein